MKIKQIRGREIFDSRGLPTIECTLTLEDGTFVTAAVPSGASRSSYAAIELRDGGERLMGYGVSKAIATLENIIAPALIGREPDVVQMDLEMIGMDGTDNKKKLGANTMLAASIAIIKAQAIAVGVTTYELIAHLCDFDSLSLPFPMFNVINGGVHADNNLSIQECLLVPFGFKDFRSAMEASVTVFHTLKTLLIHHNKKTLVGDEGGFASNFCDEREALNLLMEAIEQSGMNKKGSFGLALDVAATQLYDAETKLYNWNDQSKSTQELIKLYAQLVNDYPIYSIEDGLSENDWDGWILMTQQLGEKLQIVGDDIFATNPSRIMQGIQDGVANAAIIKPNQVGTVTETLQTIKLCKEQDIKTIVSHRSGETEDTFIVDLAVGTSAGQIKAGGCSRGERLAKYNQLLRIEDELLLAMLGA